MVNGKRILRTATFLFFFFPAVAPREQRKRQLPRTKLLSDPERITRNQPTNQLTNQNAGDEHIVLATTHPTSLIDAFNQAADILDNMEKCEPAPESGAAQIKYEYNDKFG